MKKYLLFDLDGTLSDPKIGICTCVQYALASFGIEEPDLDKLEPFIGPPLKQSFMEFYNMTEEQSDAAVAKYRERFSDVGLFENTLYDGIPAMLQALNAKGMHLAVASSKPTVFVEKILEHFGIRRYFKVVVGSELDGRRSNKEEVVDEALRQLFGEKEVDTDEVYMIGDRKFDVEGAKIHGIESVAVAYGYGSVEELREARADYIVKSVAELKSFLLRGTDDAPKGLDLQRLWKTAFPLIMFLVIRWAAIMFVRSMYISMGGELFGIKLLTYDENSMPNGVTPNANAVLQIIGFIAGALSIKKGACIMIDRAAQESKLLHLRKEPGSTYAMMGVAAVGAMFGLNMLLQLVGATTYSASYQNVAQTQFAVNVVLGIILYGIVAPVAEEMLFRGIIYNGLKRSLKPISAMLLAAAIFGGYHGNSIQALYGFLMGCLFIYAYEYFGDIKVPVVMHAGVNLITFLSSPFFAKHPGLVSFPLCLICLALAGGCLYVLKMRKKVFAK